RRHRLHVGRRAARRVPAVGAAAAGRRAVHGEGGGAALGAGRAVHGRGQRGLHAGLAAAGGPVPAVPPGGAPPAQADRLVDARDDRGDGVVVDPAAAARRLRRELPALHRDRAHHHRHHVGDGALRGGGNWVAYLHFGEAWLPAGWTVASSVLVIVCSALAAGLG